MDENNYKHFAIGLAKKAGEVMRANFVLGMDTIIKKDGSPVTKTDLAINTMVIDEVKKHFPSHSVLGEEESSPVPNSEYSWVCDPVDGTIAFSHGMPTCVFSLALVKDGDPILGVAYDPFLDRMFTAEKGKGAFVNEKKIHVSSHGTIKGAYITVGNSPRMKYQIPHLIDDLTSKEEGEFFGMHSIVYNAALLAAGQLDGMIWGGETAHDAAALKVIIEEAGGKVTDIFGNEQRYDGPVKGCVATNALIHDELLNLVRTHLKF